MRFNLTLSDNQKTKLINFLKTKQLDIIQMFKKLDPNAKLKCRSWKRDNNKGGGGDMKILRGDIVEKAGCNVSVIYGDQIPQKALNNSQNLMAKIKNKNNNNKNQTIDTSFFATGLSTIVHMFNPHAPIAHLNVRLFEFNDQIWFGGGADLTPCITYKSDNDMFFDFLKKTCMDHHPDKIKAFKEYKKYCDEYYYIKHRKEHRGAGGIFFDNLQLDFNIGFKFISNLVENYQTCLQKILAKRIACQFCDKQKQDQLYFRARYVEFNLLYDRGTKFGLDSGGDIEAIFISLPPLVKW